MEPKLRRKILATLIAVACVASLVVHVAAPSASAASGLTKLSETQITSRMTDYRFQTDALSGPTTARVIFPRNFDASGATRYPVLYLLHGGAADYTSWTRTGGIADTLTDGLDLITVMPDAGRSAWYADWYNNGLGGFPKWETYHIKQLIPWIDANLPTVGDRSGRAIAGLSSGGFGAMSYASRHPDLFVAAAAFSGAVDTNTPPVVAGKVVDAFALQDAGPPGSLFGLRETEEARWRGHNPWDLADNLRGMALAVRTGNGMAGGTYGGGGPADPGGYFLEYSVHDMSISFHNRLTSLDIPHVWDDYGPGTHSFPYWNRSLERTLPMFMQVFAEHRPAPSPFSYRSIEQTYDIYGWTVSMNRPVVEFSALDNVTKDGFRLSGSGAATVTSPPVYEPGRSYTATMRTAGGQMSSIAAADGDGRITLHVPLGPANLTQQYFTPTGDSPATTVYSTDVAISL